MQQFLVQTHHIFSQMIGLYSLAVGAWGLFLFIRRRPPDGNYNGALAIAVPVSRIADGTIFTITTKSRTSFSIRKL